MANVILNALRSITCCHLLCTAVAYQSKCRDRKFCVITCASNNHLSVLYYSLNRYSFFSQCNYSKQSFLNASWLNPHDPTSLKLWLHVCQRGSRRSALCKGYQNDTPVTQQHQVGEHGHVFAPVSPLCILRRLQRHHAKQKQIADNWS